ncbi:glucosaminidase domain-containing protein [Saccharicrinis sp. FJH62]|uniref:glucosaminidase domain-containing protein n=1 Tax=Saccharicrinis sp. FJH62 TaxID=3344657 RepID=UPI0035D453A9
MIPKRPFLVSVLLMVIFAMNAQTLTREDYVEKFAPIAIREMQRYGIPASITLAQGILESSNGNSYLARVANNHFGIKCHDWTGPSVHRDDDMRNECFRKYKEPVESFEDHSKFLTSRERYRILFELKVTDYKGWARGLKKAGYATDPQYANRLIKIIEDNELFLYDRGVKVEFTEDEVISTRKTRKQEPVDNFVIKPFSSHQIYSNNKVNYVKVRPGDSFQSISQEFNLRDWELYKYNDLPEDAYLTSGQVVYIQPKRNRSKNYEFHVAKEDESMREISQRYGIRLRSLYKKNNMDKGTQPQPGQRIYLKHHKPSK